MTGIIVLIVAISILFMLALSLALLCMGLSSKNNQFKAEVEERRGHVHRLQKEVEEMKAKADALYQKVKEEKLKQTQISLDNTLTGMSLLDLDIKLEGLYKPKPTETDIQIERLNSTKPE